MDDPIITFIASAIKCNEKNDKAYFTNFNCDRRITYNFHPRAEGYPDSIKNLIMEPSYRDAVEVRVVDQIKKDMFSDAKSSNKLSDRMIHFFTMTVLILLHF